MIKRVKYIGPEMVTLEKGKIYDVIEIDHGLFRIMSEMEDDYLFPPELFEIVDDCAPGKEGSGHECGRFLLEQDFNLLYNIGDRRR